MPEVWLSRFRIVMRLQPGGASGKEACQRILERELAVLHLEHDGRRRELLPERARLEDRLGLHGHLVLDVGEPVALELDHFPAAHDRDPDPGDPLRRTLGFDERVEAIGLGRSGRSGEREQDERGDETARQGCSRHAL